jgi:hypothetical protein
VEILSHSVDEKLVAKIVGLSLLLVSDRGSYVVNDPILVFSKHQVGDLTRVKNVIDVFQESFV